MREIAALGLEMVRIVKGRGGGNGRVSADDRRGRGGKLIDRANEAGVYLRGEPFRLMMVSIGRLEVVVMLRLEISWEA